MFLIVFLSRSLLGRFQAVVCETERRQVEIHGPKPPQGLYRLRFETQVTLRGGRQILIYRQGRVRCRDEKAAATGLETCQGSHDVVIAQVKQDIASDDEIRTRDVTF